VLVKNYYKITDYPFPLCRGHIYRCYQWGILAVPEFKRSLAVVIGINQYDVNNGIPALETAVHDAKKLAFILADKYQYQVLPLLDTDATQSRLDSLLAAFTQKILPLSDGSKVQIEPDDRVLFYFAGHGIALDGLDNAEGPAGYLVPQDARVDDSSTLLPMQRLHDALVQLPCRHLLIILDCCFAGTFRWAGLHRDAVRSERMYRERYERFTSGCAQQVITSAAYDEKALDSLYRFGQRGKLESHSPFADLLLKALNGAADLTQDGVLTATELYVYLHSELGKLTTKQTPGFCQLKRHDKGEYIFVSPNFVEEELQKAPLLDENSNPYRGLKSFDEADKELFFGRQRVINELYAHLSKREKPPLTVVLGASGTGKSSVVKAGLLPRLREKQWQIIGPLRPGKSPLTALAKAVLHATNAIARDDLNCINVLSEKLRQAPQIFTEMVSLGNNCEQKLILVIDQFEELVTMCEPEEQQQFLSWLKAVLVSNLQRLHVVITLRSDFEPQFSSVLLERSDWMAARFVVPPMTQDELREVIEKPASETMMYFEPPKLVERLINDVVQMPGALPLLSFTLSELYLKYLQRRGNNRAMTQEDYEDLGGVMGSVTKRATEEYERLVKLNPANKQTVRRVMLRMVSVEGGESARRRVPETELVYRNAEENGWVQQVIKAFFEAHLIVKGINSEGESYVEPAHDALVRGWDKLQQWKTQEQANLLLQRELTPEAKKWAVSNKKQAVGLLWNDDPRLPLVEQVLKSGNSWLNSLESEFVESSIQRRLNNRRRLIGAVATFIGIVSTVAVVAVMQRNLAIQGQLNALVALSEARSSRNDRLGALIASVQAGAQLDRANMAWVGDKNRTQTLTALRDTVDGMQEQNRMEEHSDKVNSVSFSPDGQTIASASDDGTIKVWSFNTNRRLIAFSGGGGRITSISFSPDGQAIASAHEQNIVKLWRLDGTLLKTLQGHNDKVTSVSFSPDGQLVVSAGWDRTVKLWRLDGTLLKTFKGHGNKVNSVSFSPDGQLVVSAGWYRTVKLWRLDGTLLKTFKGHGGIVTSASFSPDGQIIASASEDKTIKLWNLNGALRQTLEGHSDSVLDVSFSCDNRNGQILASASADNTIKLWRLDGTLLQTLRGHSSRVMSVRFSPNNQTIASASWDNTVKLWNLDRPKTFHTLNGHTDKVWGVSFSPDGQTVASTSTDKTVKLWKLDGTLLRTFEPRSSWVTSVSFSPKGNTLVSASHNIIELWRLDGTLLHTIKGHGGRVWSVSFSPDGQTIASGSADQTVRLWKLDGTVLQRFRGHTAPVWSVSFSPDGQMVASGSDDKTVRLWKIDGTLLKTFQGHEGTVTSVSFSPDRQMVASGSDDKTVRLWKIDGTLVKTFRGHESTVTSISFSPDGQMLASGSEDKTVKIWRLDGTLLQTLQGHSDRVWAVNFSPDGKRVASASDDKTVIVWSLETLKEPLDNLLVRACDWLADYLKNPNTNLSQEERHSCDGISTSR
jgi:WD40 repeat protein/uncharacterized caspase-like protein